MFAITIYHWCKVISNDQTPSRKTFRAFHSLFKELKTYIATTKDPLWVQAIHVELQALETSITWDIVPLPIVKKPIGCKWVYKIKMKSYVTLKRYKARLVAKDYTQEYDIDYQEIFSPVVKMASICYFIAIVTF